MRKRVYGAWIEPDLSHAGLVDPEAHKEAIHQDRDCYKRDSSRIPDPLSVLLAAESGRPILFPVFPLNAFTPARQCDHANRPIAKGSSACCMDCHDTGLRDHPALRLIPADIPAREPEPTRYDPVAAIDRVVDPDLKVKLGATLDNKPPPGETRKQRRARLYAERTSGDDADRIPA